ncbi:MAG: serine hydrolase [Sulfitobacter sp.]
MSAKVRSTLLIAVSSFALPFIGHAQNLPSLSGLLDTTHGSTVENYGFFGSTAAIQFGDGSRWTNATGVTGPQNASQGGRALTVDDRFHIGSQTKTYTGTVVLKYVDDGIVNLDDSLQDWFLKEPDATSALSVMSQDLRETVTIRDLLSMRSGIPEYLAGPDPTVANATVLDVWNANNGNYDLTRQQLLSASLALDPTMTPGDQSTFSYSNANFMLAGIIAEAASCQAGDCRDIGQLITDRVITPLGLQNTLYPTGTEWGTTEHTNGTWNYNGTLTDYSETTPSVPNSAGAMISNVGDQLTWLVEVTTNANGTLSPATFAERLVNTTDINGMVGTVPGGYGLGLYGQQSLETGAFMLGHGGELSGYQTLMFQYPGDLSTTLDDLFIVSNINTFLNVPGQREFLPSDINNIYYDLQKTAVVYDTFIANPDGCTSDAVGTTCTATTAATTTLQVSDAFTVQPSGNYWFGTERLLPTYVSYGDDSIGVAATDTSVLIERGGILAGYGNGMTLLQLNGQANRVEVFGDIEVTGAGATAIDASTPSDDTIHVARTGSVIGAIRADQGADRLNIEGAVTGDITLGAEARLEGGGMVQGMISGDGTTAPGTADGNGPSSLTISRYEPTGGALEINLSSATNSATSLIVDVQTSEGFPVPDTGLAVLKDTTLRLTGTPLYGDFQVPILITKNGLTNQFSQIVDDTGSLNATDSRLQYDVVYTKDSAYLTSTSPAAFDAVAASSYSDSLTILDQSLGHSLANARRTLQNSAGFARNLGSSSSYSSQDGGAGFHIGTLGLLGGFGGPLRNGGYYEVSIAQTSTDASLDQNGGDQETDMLSAGVSLGFALGPLDTAFSVFYSEGDVDYQRNTGDGFATGSTEQQRWSAILGMGQSRTRGKWDTGWRSSLAYFRSSEDAFQETSSGPIALGFEDRSYERARLGIGIKSERKPRNLALSPWVSADVFYHADLSGSDIQFDATDGIRTLEGRTVDGLELQFGAGASYTAQSGARLLAGVTASKRDEATTYRFDASISFDF